MKATRGSERGRYGRRGALSPDDLVRLDFSSPQPHRVLAPSPRDLLGLQTAAGNAAVSRLVAHSLPVGHPFGAAPLQRQSTKVPDRRIGDTPGTRTPDLTAGVEESRDRTHSFYNVLDRAECEIDQMKRIHAEREAHRAAGGAIDDEFWLEKLMYCKISKCDPPEVLLGAIKRWQFRGQPQAVKNLDWYVAGSGQDLEQPMEGGLLADTGVRSQLTALVNAQAPPVGTPLELAHPIDQGHYANQEWRNALGNIDKLTVTIVGPGTAAKTARVRVTLEDPYQWHPGDARVTQCIHEFFESLKLRGASEYMAVGTGEVDLPLDPPLIPPKRVVPPTTTGSGSKAPAGPPSAGGGSDSL